MGLLLFPKMLDMKYAVDTEGESLLPDGHFDTSVDPYRRPQQWQQGEGILLLRGLLFQKE